MNKIDRLLLCVFIYFVVRGGHLDGPRDFVFIVLAISTMVLFVWQGEEQS